MVVARAQYAPYALAAAAPRGTTRGGQHSPTPSPRPSSRRRRVLRFGACCTARRGRRPTSRPASGSTEGATTQGELALDQILFMRPVAGWGRYAMPIRGLYLGGAGTHPGPGVLGGSGVRCRAADDLGRAREHDHIPPHRDDVRRRLADDAGRVLHVARDPRRGERAALRTRSWICVGRASRLAEAGRLRRASRSPASRSSCCATGRARCAHSSTCAATAARAFAWRPRAASRETIQCPYHAWTYAHRRTR